MIQAAIVRRTFVTALLTVGLLVSPGDAGGPTAGSPDMLFGQDGQVVTTFGRADDDGYALARQADGRLILAGQTDRGSGDIALMRVLADGSRDTSFPTVITDAGGGDDAARAVVVGPDGKIVIAGHGATAAGSTSDFLIARYTSDGKLDPLFASAGLALIDFEGGADEAHALAVQADGKVLAAGHVEFPAGDIHVALARLNPDGSLDPTFGADGRVTVAFPGASSGTVNSYGRGLAVQTDGRIVVAGYTFAGYSPSDDFALARLNGDGSPDTTFDRDGLLRRTLRGPVMPRRPF